MNQKRKFGPHGLSILLACRRQRPSPKLLYIWFAELARIALSAGNDHLCVDSFASLGGVAGY